MVVVEVAVGAPRARLSSTRTAAAESIYQAGLPYLEQFVWGFWSSFELQEILKSPTAPLEMKSSHAQG